MIEGETNGNSMSESVELNRENSINNNQQLETNTNNKDHVERDTGATDAQTIEPLEIISPVSKSSSTNHNMEQESKNDQDGQVKLTGDTKPRSNSETPKVNQEKGRKKSNSFLSRLQSSSEENENSTTTNIQQSLVSAFSSFTSNFSLGPSSTSSNNGNIYISSTNNYETSSLSSKQYQLQETKEEIFKKKAALERKNLISLTKLIVKDLIISSSLLHRRAINDCQNAVHLNNYFTLIDRVLKHGLKQNLLTNRSANLWNALDNLPKYLKESNLMSESVRSLANTKTSDGKIKAWMRLVMMQKKLPEYFRELIANKNDLLKDIYHDYAFMMNDEAQIFAGLIIGVNVIDCNFFVKDANFDLMDDIIDLGPYLKVANSYDDDKDDNESKYDGPDMKKLTAILDQKNYLEEWNKKLESTIVDLKAKIKSLEGQNIKLEMEAKLNEVRLSKLQIDNSSSSSSIAGAFKSLISSSEQQSNNNNKLFIETGSSPSESKSDSIKKVDCHVVAKEGFDKQTREDEDLISIQDDQDKYSTTASSSSKAELVVVKDDIPTSTEKLIEIELQKQIEQQAKELNSLRERASILEASYREALEKIKNLERELDIQTSMNADKETTIKIYEKDIREKQNQVESLKSSLNDYRKLNSDLNERLNDANNKLKDRVKSVSNLQASLDKWKLENKTMATRFQEKQVTLKTVSQELEQAKSTIENLKKYNERINDELKKERESGQSSSVTVETQNARIMELQDKLAVMEGELKDVAPYRNQTEELSQRCRDYELSLEEIGSQLRESRLEVENLKENSAVYLDSQWQNSKQVKLCTLCQQSFSVTRRKHHCRLCGNVFCQACSDNKMELASSAKPVRVCDTCHSFLLAKFVKSST